MRGAGHLACIKIMRNIWNKNQLMSLFQFYSYIAGSLHVSAPQAHLRRVHTSVHTTIGSVSVLLWLRAL